MQDFKSLKYIIYRGNDRCAKYGAIIMHLEFISLRNFKCFSEVNIPLSKITILTGENSSGKSALINGYLSSIQSEGFPFQLSVNGRFVNMGDFKEMAHQAHQSKTPQKDQFVDINLRFIDDSDEVFVFKTRWGLDRKSSMPRAQTLEVRAKYFDFRISPSSSDDKYWFSLRHHEQEKFLQTEEFKFGKALYELLEGLAETPSEQSKVSRKSLADEYVKLKNVRRLKFSDFRNLNYRLSENYYLNAIGALSETERFLKGVNSRFNYIGSYRLQPERAYYRQTRSDLRLGVLGEKYVDQILEWENSGARQLKDLQSALRKTGLLNTLRTRKLRGGRFELRVKPRAKGNWAALTDVGFGISQFLPVLVADLQLRQGSTLAVAQPELHLHPSVQASVADYFINQVVEGSKRYIIETHSEYLLNRFRLGIVRGKLDPADVSVYYFENDGEVSTVSKVDFLRNGRIDNAPNGFFETYMMDTMAIALNTEAE